MDDQIIISGPITGKYSISVIPNLDADLTETVTLIMEDHGQNTILLDEVVVSDLPSIPIEILVDRNPPVLSIEAVPNILTPCNGQIISINISLLVKDETDTNPQIALISIRTSWEADANTLIFNADYEKDDRNFELLAFKHKCN